MHNACRVTAQAITFEGAQSVMSICRDNTVKRHFDALMLKAAMEWQNTFDAIEDSVFLRSPEHRILRCNKASYAAFDKGKPGEMLGKRCWEVVHGTSEQLPNCPIVVMQKTKRRESAVFRSDARWLEVTVDPVLDENNNITGAIHVVSDITERKLADGILQARLRLSEFALTHTLAELLQKTLDEAELLTESSIGFLHFVGADQKTLLLQAWSTNTLSSMCTAEGKGRHYDISQAGVWADCIRERRPVIHNDYAGLPQRKGLPPGHAPVTRQLAVPVFRGGQITAILGVGNKSSDYNAADIKTISALADIAWDIARCKRAEDELSRSEEKYRQLHESMIDAFILVDLAGKIMETNRSFREMLGYSEDELSALSYKELTPLQWHDMEAGIVKRQILARGYSEVYEKEYRSKDGFVIPVELRTFLLRNGNGEPAAMWAIVRDLTDRKRAEVEKAELEERNRQLHKAESLDRMAGAISHHFNNQLHVVTGYLGMLIGDMPPGDPNVEKLEKAMQAARKASEVSTLLITFLGQKPGKLELLDLSELCRESLPILQAGMSKDITLETDLPAPGPVITANAKQIQQMLTNLMLNAWDAIGEGNGVIRLNVRTVYAADIPSVHRFPVAWRPQQAPYACLELMDSGCGIQEKDMGKIFDPFFSTKLTGMGLGLSVVLGIVRAHEAVVTAEGSIKGGSIFRVFFPLSSHVAPSRYEPAVKVPEIVSGGIVLLVEDEAIVRKMTEIALVKSGFTVLPARDGVEAVEIFRQRRDEISCLISDLTMPRMDGWETITALRTLRRDLPVILASGYDEDSVMAGEHPEMPDFFLNKPYELNKLGNIIARVVARKREIS